MIDIEVREIIIDEKGYDKDGCYFGHFGRPIFAVYAYTRYGNIEELFRADSMKHARNKISKCLKIQRKFGNFYNNDDDDNLTAKLMISKELEK